MTDRLAHKLISYCNFVIEYTLIFLVVASPIAFGAVQPWADSAMQFAILVLANLWLIKSLVIHNLKTKGNTSKRTFVNSKILVVVIVSTVLFVVLVALQLVPLQPRLLLAISPNTYKLYQITLNNFNDHLQTDTTLEIDHINSSNRNGALTQNRPLSLNPYITRRALLRLRLMVILIF